MQQNNLQERIFKFVINIVKLIRKTERSVESNIIKQQLIRSVTSIGANYEEAQGAFSRNDFKYKVSICYKEIKETQYWLKIMLEVGILEPTVLAPILAESEELKAIFITILKRLNHKI